jgi:hypothetical protein
MVALVRLNMRNTQHALSSPTATSDEKTMAFAGVLFTLNSVTFSGS